MVLPLALPGAVVSAMDESFIKRLHSSLQLRELPHSEHGQYKREQNWPGSRLLDHLDDVDGYAYFTPPDQVQAAVHAMLAELLRREAVVASPGDVLETAAWLHWRFVQIHPFLDGNGRVGRLLLNAYLVVHGFPLSSIQPECRHVYFASLHSAWLLAREPRASLPPLALLHRIVSESVLRSLELMAD